MDTKSKKFSRSGYCLLNASRDTKLLYMCLIMQFFQIKQPIEEATEKNISFNFLSGPVAHDKTSYSS